jgi:hypothetical protein
MPEFGRSRKNRIQLEAKSAEAREWRLSMDFPSGDLSSSAASDSLEIDERLKEDGKLRLATSRKILVLGALTSGKARPSNILLHPGWLNSLV